MVICGFLSLLPSGKQNDVNAVKFLNFQLSAWSAIFANYSQLIPCLRVFQYQKCVSLSLKVQQILTVNATLKASS